MADKKHRMSGARCSAAVQIAALDSQDTQAKLSPIYYSCVMVDRALTALDWTNNNSTMALLKGWQLFFIFAN